MTLADVLGTTTGGVRSALVLLGVTVLIAAWHSPATQERIDVYRQRTIVLFALACVTYSPVHAAMLLDHPLPICVVRALDLLATTLGCASLIHILAARAVLRGVPMFRIRRAMVANASIVLGFILVAWTIP